MDAELRAKLDKRAARLGHERGRPMSTAELVREVLEREAGLEM